MDPTTLTPRNARLRLKYLRNEGINYHTENLLLLAKNFGTEQEVAECERRLRSMRPEFQGCVYCIPRPIADHINSYYQKHLLP